MPNFDTRIGKGHTCGLDIEHHIKSIVMGAGMMGTGFGCEDTYRALLEIAAGLKRYYGYDDYTPTGEAVYQSLEQLPVDVPANAPVN